MIPITWLNQITKIVIYDAVMYDESPDGDLIQCDTSPDLTKSGSYHIESNHHQGIRHT